MRNISKFKEIEIGMSECILDEFIKFIKEENEKSQYNLVGLALVDFVENNKKLYLEKIYIKAEKKYNEFIEETKRSLIK